MPRLRSVITALLLAGFFAVPQSRAQATQPPTPSGALIQLGNEATNWLQDLIRINTTNPPGNELAAAKYIGGILDKEGIHYEIFETAPGRGFIVARLSSTPVPDPARALLLMGHLDVVGVDRSKWTVDPFAGVINGSYLYGRGAVDDKAMTIANLATLIELKRTNAHLNRDVIFLAEPDEEDGGGQGMQIIVDKYWDKIAAGFAINESGQVALKDGKVQYVGIQVSEKVAANVDVIAKGTSGHASIPLKDNPVSHLAEAIAKIAAYEPPVEFDSVTRAYFETLSNVEDEDTAKWMKVLETPDRGDHAARIISDDNPVWSAMIHDTISPTMLEAGVRDNVIPAEAKAVLNIRLLPGDSLQVTLAKLTSLVSDPEISFEVEPGTSEPAPSSSVTSDLYQAIAHAAAAEFPGAPVTPYLSTGATDSSFLRERNVQAYGLLPFPLTEADRLTMHADNERIPLDSFHKGIDFLYSVVSDFAVEK